MKVPRSEWEPQITKKIDEIVKEKQKTLERIQHLFIGQRLDKSKLLDTTKFSNNTISEKDVKRFIERFIKRFNGSIITVDKDKDIYKIIVPSILVNDLKKIKSKIVLIGTFYKSNLEYLALGNRTIMTMLKHISKPIYSIFYHSELKGFLFIYRIRAIDGRNGLRNGKIICTISNNGKTNLLNIIDIIKSEIYDYDSHNFPEIDENNFKKTYSDSLSYIEQIERGLKKDTEQIMEPITKTIKKNITNYYDNKISKIEIEKKEYLSLKHDSPNYSILIEKKKQEQKKIGKEYLEDIRKLDKDSSIRMIRELVGIALILPPTPLDKTKRDHNNFILSEFSRKNSQINSEISSTTYSRFKKNPDEWYKYHELFEEAKKNWDVIPVYEIIDILSKLSNRLMIGDFGCGKGEIMKVFGYNRVFSCDHIAIKDKIVSCDMKRVPPSDGSLDVVVFSLSLMGQNWKQYISEARRCLAYKGTIIIAETTHSLTERLSTLYDTLEKEGFGIDWKEQKGLFTIIVGTKRYNYK
jgi:hypothetical protein